MFNNHGYGDEAEQSAPKVPMSVYNVEAEEDEENAYPLVSFGLFADVKYSSKNNYVKRRGPDAVNYYPESSLDQLNDALGDWNQSTDPVSFLINLGNLTEEVEGQGYDRDSALVLVLNTLEKCPRPKYHVLGHHELKQFTRRELHHSKLHSAVNAPGAVPANHDRFYYHFSPTPGVRIVCIDLYELALVGYQDDEDCQEHCRAKNIIARKNPNANPRECDGLDWQNTRFTSLNGGTSNIQLQWLVEVLDYSEKAGEIVVVCGHNPLCVSDKKKFCRVPWNNEEVINVLHKFPCVVAYFSGHDPTGGYLQDSNGIHHLNMPGICETPGSANCYATVHVHRDRLEVVGGGKVPNMSLKHHGQAQMITKIAKPVETPVHAEPQVIAPPAELVPAQPHVCPPMPPPPMPVVFPTIQVPAPQMQPMQMPQLPPMPAMPPPTIIRPPPQPHLVPVLIRKPAVTRAVTRVITKTSGGRPGNPPPILAARMERQAAMNNMGPIRRAIPVTVAVPMDRINAMGGVKRFQLAPVPTELIRNGQVQLSRGGGTPFVVQTQ